MTNSKIVRAALSLLACDAIFIAAVSFFPDHYDIYGSAWAVALWGATAYVGSIGIWRAKLCKNIGAFLLHCALLAILAGALITHITGKSDNIHLRVGERADAFGNSVDLVDFRVEYYPATSAPSDFIALINVGGKAAQISMNHTADIGGLRIFIASCDSDRQGCRLTITKDTAGTLVTYSGYLLLLVSMCLVSLKRRRAPALATALILAAWSSYAAPRAIPVATANELGNLYVYHNDRVAPLSTLARDFTIKIYGTDHYRGLTPEQVMSGWLFYYDDWKGDPGIKIKDDKAREIMGLGGKRASIKDFFGKEGYLFDEPDFAEVNEKFALVSSAATGALWRLFPYRTDSLPAQSPIAWYSPVDQTPSEMDLDSWRMTRHSFGYLAELVARGEWQEAENVIRKIKKYQQAKCPGSLPSPSKVKAERLFLNLSGSVIPIAIIFICALMLIARQNKAIGLAATAAAGVWILFLICLNGYASGHIPMSNGYETMQWMALFSLAVTARLGAKWPQILPLGLIVASMALGVALMGQSNPQLTNLMPVLRSPLLSAHVLAMMMAYALLATMAAISCMRLLGRRGLMPLAIGMLRPAVFLLAAGIFIGAVWANASWGRYWGWDPKETWALITLIAYSIPLHRASLPLFRSERVLAIYLLAAFSTVLMTYFGVNFILGGLHSYA